MIIQEQSKDLYIVGEDSSKKAKISADKMAKLQYLLTKGLYKDPITAVIAEWANNAVDSIVEAGKNPIENPVIVYLGRNDKDQLVFSVEDKGTGLDNNDFENICMNYLESTKEGNNDTIGHFGIGMKSFLSLERSATFICRKEGVERIYNVYEGAEFVNYDLIVERPTTEENGVKAEITLLDNYEFNRFCEKAKQKLCYYDTVVLLIDGKPVENEIFRSDSFQWSSLNKNGVMHLCLKDVYYSIDWEALGVSQIHIPISLRFDLSSGITPTPSRESYITNEKTKALILNKIKETATWFVNKYNDTVVKEFEKFMDGFNLYGASTYTVKLDNTAFTINQLLTYSEVKIKPYTVKGLKLKDALFYKLKREEFFDDFSIIARKDYYSWKTKRLYHNISSSIISKEKVIVINQPFTGYVRDYLKEKYSSGGTTIIRRIGSTRKLWNPRTNVWGTFEQILELDRRNKGNWRAHIEEWFFLKKQLEENFIYETDLQDSTEFLAFIEKRREDVKSRRNRGESISGYLPLNKQDGEVTLAYSYSSVRGISFKKSTYKVAELHKNKYLTVLVEQDDSIKLVKDLISSVPNHVKFATVGNFEIRKIPNNKQFIKFKNFMSRDCKPFMRIASSILFSNVINDFKSLRNKNNEEIINKLLEKYVKAEQELKDYVRENHIDYLSDSTEDAILNIAHEKDLFDKELWDKYLLLKEGIGKYDFITLLDKPSSFNQEGMKAYNKLISQLLLFRKKYYNEFPENARIVFDEVKEEVDEKIEQDEEDLEEGEFDINGEIVEDEDLVTEEF